jgi:hypothetical protein
MKRTAWTGIWTAKAGAAALAGVMLGAGVISATAACAAPAVALSAAAPQLTGPPWG